MDDDKTRQDTPATDQGDTPIKNKTPAKKIIIVRDNGQGKQTNPESHKVKKMGMDEKGKDFFWSAEIEEETIENVRAVFEKALTDAGKTINPAENVQKVLNFQFDISKVIEAIAKANSILPQYASAEEFNRVYDELEKLKPLLDAEITKLPQYEGRTFDEVFSLFLEPALYYFVTEDRDGEPDIEQGELPEYEREDDEQAKQTALDLLEIRRAARAAANAKKKRKKNVFIDPIGIKNADFLPLLNGSLTNEIMRLSAQNFTVDGINAYYTAPNGHKYTIEQQERLLGSLDTSTKKMLDAATLYLTSQNYNRSTKNINPTVLMPLIDYGEKNGYTLTAQKKDTKEEQDKENKRVKDRIKDFRNRCRRDLSDLEKITWTAEETGGRNAGNYINLRIISGHGISNGVIKINFDIDAARYLINGGPIFFPTVLFSIDNRKPNTYSIGRKLAFHNSLDSNYFMGTDCSLSVKKLLDAAPEIPTKKELDDSGQRNWKHKIKRPLETSLNELKDLYPIITKWEYRHPKTGQTYTAETAQTLTWDTYSSLIINWTMKAQPQGQAERRARIAAEKAAAEAAGKLPKKKRGRPKKKPDGPQKETS